MTHVLAFSDVLYGYYQDASLNTIGKENVMRTVDYGLKQVPFIVTPKVKEMARAHYACSSLIGLPVEVSGGSGSAGSHWEKTVSGYDYMTGMVSYHMLITNVTLALLEDSGWYKPDYTSAEPMWWGKNRGCDFTIYDKCSMGNP